MDEYPLDFKEEVLKLSEWIEELNRIYNPHLCIKLIDAQALLGIYKSLRHWIRKYPTFIVEGRETYTGWDKRQLENLLVKFGLPRKEDIGQGGVTLNGNRSKGDRPD
jgi:hypothetical protein